MRMMASGAGSDAQRLDVIGQRLLAAGVAHPEQAPVGKHRHGAGLVEQAAFVAVDLGTVKPDHRERIVERQAGLDGKGLGTLGDQTAVGTVEQHDRDTRVGARQPGIDLVRFLLCHGVWLAWCGAGVNGLAWVPRPTRVSDRREGEVRGSPPSAPFLFLRRGERWRCEAATEWGTPFANALPQDRHNPASKNMQASGNQAEA